MSWLLVFLTGGVYSLFWIWGVANELNSAERREVFKVRRWRLIFLLLIAALFLAVIVAEWLNVWSPVLLVAVCLLTFWVSVQVAIGGYIKRKDRELGTGAAYSNGIFLILFWCVANLGVAYMQVGINRIVRTERSASA